MYNAHLVCYQISLWDSHRSEISGLQTERAVSLHSKSDLSLESSNWESLHNSLGWTGLDLDLLSKHQLGSGLGGRLDASLDPAEAWDSEDASLLDLHRARHRSTSTRNCNVLLFMAIGNVASRMPAFTQAPMVTK